MSGVNATGRIRGLFYFATILSVMIFIIGIILPIILPQSISPIQERNYDISGYLILYAFCIWAWLIIIGLLFVPKNWIVILVCLGLLIPHIIYTAVTLEYSFTFIDVLKRYVYFLSFGLILL